MIFVLGIDAATWTEASIPLYLVRDVLREDLRGARA